MTQETAAQNIMQQIKFSSENKKTEELKRKQMHGHFYRDLEITLVDKQKTQAWLRSSGLQGETESLVIVAQDQALNMCYQRTMMKQPTYSNCRMSYKAEEHIKHINVGCTTLGPSEYTNRHNKLAGYICWLVCKHIEL